MLGLLDLSGVAAFRGVHYDTARKAWRGWVKNEGFPAPVRVKRPYRWNPASIDAWAARQEAASRAALLRPASDFGAAANQNDPDAPPARPTARRIDRERSAVLALMQSPQAAPRAVGEPRGA